MKTSAFRYSWPVGVMAVAVDRVRQLLLSIAVTGTSRVCVLRDRWIMRGQRDDGSEQEGIRVSRHAIRSGANVLDAVLVRPAAAQEQASVLICHGIGETVGVWRRVQTMLAECGVSSLVFDYSGYGRSSGFFNSRQAERDAVAAFQFLSKATAPLPVALMGMSLGSGVALAIHTQVPLDRLVLLGAFTSLRAAARSVGIPQAFGFAVPPIWSAQEALRDCRVPVLLVHGEMDALFPVKMAEELAGYCGSIGKLVVVPGVSHNEPFYSPRLAYWGEIVAWFLIQDAN